MLLTTIVAWPSAATSRPITAGVAGGGSRKLWGPPAPPCPAMPDGLKITPVVYAQTELPDSVHIVTRTQSEPSQEGTVRAVVAERVAAWTTDDPESTILAGRNGCLSIKVWE